MSWSPFRLRLRTGKETFDGEGVGFPVASVVSVFGRTGAVVAAVGDYTAALVTGAADKLSAFQQVFTASVKAPELIAGAGGEVAATGAGVTSNPSSAAPAFQAVAGNATSALAGSGLKVVNIAAPAADDDAATKGYVDGLSRIPQGGPLTTDLLAGGRRFKGETAAGGGGGMIQPDPGPGSGAGGASNVTGGGGAAGQVGGDAILLGGDGNNGGQAGAIITAGGGGVAAAGTAAVRTKGAAGVAGQALVSDAAGGLKYGGVQVAAGAPGGAPTGLPFAYDTTLVTGGFYFWNGAAWVKVATII